MKLDKKLIEAALKLYAVTDRRWLKTEELKDQIEMAIKGGITMVQLREKDLGKETFRRESDRIRDLCKNYNIPFIVNDNVEIAIETGADGIHVGQSDMEVGSVRKLIGEDMILGVSAQTVEQALIAESKGADYLGVGAIFPTNSKDDADSVSIEELKAICKAVNIPVVAIGGIDNKNIDKLEGSGIVGVALISAIFGQDNIEEASRKMLSKVDSLVK